MATITTPQSTQYSSITIPNMPSVAFNVTPSDSDEFDNGIHLYVGQTGNVRCISELHPEIVTFNNFPGGLVLPVKVKKVFLTGTTASNLIGIE